MRIIKKQSGLALPVAILLLFVMTLVGVTALNTSILEENMTGNSRLRQSALYAAEMALHDAENNIAVLFSSGGSLRAAYFGEGFARPPGDVALYGDTCNRGFCTPAQHSFSLVKPTEERWNDPALDVWNDPNKHIEFRGFDTAGVSEALEDQNILEPPKYIIEFLGNIARKVDASSDEARPESVGRFLSNCNQDPDTGKIMAPNDTWPFCAADPAAFRITVRATAGPVARQAVVTLQSTVVLP